MMEVSKGENSITTSQGAYSAQKVFKKVNFNLSIIHEQIKKNQ
jgi:hypothetical protein